MDIVNAKLEGIAMYFRALPGSFSFLVIFVCFHNLCNPHESGLNPSSWLQPPRDFILELSVSILCEVSLAALIYSCFIYIYSF